MKHLRIVVLALCVLCLQADAFGQRRGKLEEGDPAPGLDIELWQDSNEVAIESEKVYLIIFFKPLEVINIPVFALLGRMLESSKGREMHVIAVDTGDSDKVLGPDEKLINHDNFHYAVDRRSSTDRAWMRAADKSDFPTVFAVDAKSTIQYIGSPMASDFPTIVGLILDDRYDAKLIKDAQRYMKPAANARKVRNFRQCFMHLDKIIEMDKRIFARQMLQKFEIMLLDQKDPDAAYEYAETLIEEYDDDPNFLSWLTEMIVTDSRIMDEDRDLDIALAAAETAFEAYSKEEPHAYALRAMVHYHRDEIMEAIDLQKLAWRIAMPREKDEHWRTLVSYKETARRSGLLTSIH